MAFTVADITGAKKQVLGLLNASSAYAATTDDDKFTDGLIAEAVFEGDERIWLAIAETKNHWARPDIMVESSDLTVNGSEVPAHTGDLGLVTVKDVAADSTYQIAKHLDAQEIDIYRRNTDSTFNAVHSATGTLTGGYCDMEALKDGIAYFTGAALRVRIAAYVRTAALQSPQAYTSAIVAFALSYLFSVDGLDPELAKYYTTLAEQAEAQVRANAKELAEMKQTA